MFVEELERERQRRRWTQAQMARHLGLSERSYRAYVSGERSIDIESMLTIARVLRSPRLTALAIAESASDNLFAPVALDVDTHAALELCAATKELQEALEALGKIDICKPDKRTLEYAIDQIFDLLHLVPLVLCSWAEAYGLDLWAVRSRNLRKLEARGYIGKEARAA